MKDPFIQQIERLERSELEGATADPFDLAHLFDTQSFLQVRGLADFWSSHPDIDFGQAITDLVISVHSQSGRFLTFVLAGTPQRLSAYISLGEAEITEAFVSAILPGIELEMDPGTEYPRIISNLAQQLSPHFYAKGLMSGIPSRKTSNQKQAANHLVRQEDQRAGQDESDLQEDTAETQGLSHLERIVRGMGGATWAYVIQAYPRPRETVIRERLSIIDELAAVMSQARGQLQKNTQSGQSITAAKNVSVTETMSGEVINYRAQYLGKLLERELARSDRAIAVGQWTVDAYFGAASIWDTQRLAALLAGTMGGKDSRPDPVRTYRCQEGRNSRHSDDFKTYLSSDEVATLIQLPREEVAGYGIHDFTRFDVDFVRPLTTSIDIGMILQQRQDTHNAYSISLNDLTKHAAVIGVTGSGKTTTVLHLLDHAIAVHTPFLVIEPAKTEYRPLRAALAPGSDVHIYTLGNEIVAPFRFNPFEFETSDTPGSGSVLNHIDVLKAVFNAAFILYAPMPYVLETALHEVYADKGWDLASGRNIRLPDVDWSRRQSYPIFPTLTDLYRKVEEVTTRLHYHGEVEQNVIAGLKARIGSLRLGSKGFMLDTARGIPLSTLLSVPTILELENIGNDDEKTFLMGLLLARLYEYRRLQAAEGVQPEGLQHLLVFEEAHRLLKQTATQVDTEAANPRAQAIEAFTNMLSEMRGYGQGVIVAEQIPSKLAPDVLKNTNLKIAHRLVAQDDRKSVGQTMNLTGSQMTHLGTLSPGVAAVYAEGADHAYLVRMENYKATHNLHSTTDSEIEKMSGSYATVENYLAIPQMDTHGVRMTRFNGPEMAIYQAAGILLEREECRQWWSGVLLSVLFNRAKLGGFLQSLHQLIVGQRLDLQGNQQEALHLMMIVRGAAEMLGERGAELGWTYALVEELRGRLTRGLVTLAHTSDLALAAGDLDYFTRKYQMRLERKLGPFVGCKHCQAKCLYRTEVSRILSKEDIRWIEDELSALAASKTRDYKPVAAMAKAIAEQWMEGGHVLAEDIGYCGSLHAVARLDLPQRAQVRFADEIAVHLL